MEAIFLVCGAGGPQLKRNPLGGSHTSDMRIAILAASAVLALAWTWSVTGLDRVKYRAWRERMAQWRASGQTPPPEYQIDNRRWRVRLGGLALGIVSLIAATIFLIGAQPSSLLLLLLYGASLLGVLTWSLLGEHVR